MKLGTFLRFFRQIKGKKPVDIDAIQSMGLLAVKLGQIFALRPDLIDPDRCIELQQLYSRAATIPEEDSQRLLDRFAARPADLPWPAAIFIATSLLHAEDVALHDRAAAFLREHTGESHAAVLSDKVLPQLESHTRVLKRFGRYPHRNQALGRETTAAESAWLASDDVPGWARSQIDVASGGTVDKM